MSSNPSPSYITDEMWQLCESRPDRGWEYSGIYADKPGYHNTVNANKKKWPSNYSIQLPLDLKGPFDKARGLDLSMSTSEMKRTTKLLRDSALDPEDTRLNALKEFYGTLDGHEVYGLGKKDENGPWYETSADDSHLYHLHHSVFTFFTNNWGMLEPIASVWRGETFEEWSNVSSLKIAVLNDTGEVVRYWQHLHNKVRSMVSPASASLTVDGIYGPASQAAFKDFWTKCGGSGGYDGSFISGWLGVQYQTKLSILTDTAGTPPTDAQVEAAVEKYLNGKIFHVTGTATLNG